ALCSRKAKAPASVWVAYSAPASAVTVKASILVFFDMPAFPPNAIAGVLSIGVLRATNMRQAERSDNLLFPAGRASKRWAGAKNQYSGATQRGGVGQLTLLTPPNFRWFHAVRHPFKINCLKFEQASPRMQRQRNFRYCCVFAT